MKKWKSKRGWKIIMNRDMIRIFRPHSYRRQILVLGGFMAGFAVLLRFIGGEFRWGDMIPFICLFPLLIPTPSITVRKWEIKPSAFTFGFKPIESLRLRIDNATRIMLDSGDIENLLIWEDDDEALTRLIHGELSERLAEKLAGAH